jgi:hypothetical protein
MQGKVEKVQTKLWNDKTFYQVKIEGSNKDYACWQKEGASIKEGDTIEFTEEEKNGRYRLTLPSTGKPPFVGVTRGKSPEEIQNQLKSFAVAYSKDITVALLTAGAAVVAVDPVKYTLDNANIIYYWLKNTK